MILPPNVSVFCGFPTDEVITLFVMRNMLLTLMAMLPPSDNEADVFIMLFCILKLLPGTFGLIRISPALRKPDDSVVTVLPVIVMVEPLKATLPVPRAGPSTGLEALKLFTEAETVALLRVSVVASTVMLPPCPVLAALVRSELFVIVTALAGGASP